MKCPNCNKPTSRMRIYHLDDGRRVKACAECLGMSETGGARTDGILTRQSDRVRQQQLKYEGDTIAPHVFDKASNKMVPNPDFVERYPEQLPTYFTEQEMKQAGYSQADKIYKHKDAKQKAHEKEANANVQYVKPKGTDGVHPDFGK